jgi:hypothetical protein
VSDQQREPDELRAASVRAIRLGHGANCSSIGSVVDTLFASAVIASAVLATILATMKREPVRTVGPPEAKPPAEDPGSDAP